MLDGYVLLVEKFLVKPRNKLEQRLLKRPNSKIKELVRKYDLSLLEKYCFIEKIMDQELSEETK